MKKYEKICEIISKEIKRLDESLDLTVESAINAEERGDNDMHELLLRRARDKTAQKKELLNIITTLKYQGLWSIGEEES